MAQPASGPPQDLLVGSFAYDPETGLFTRKIRCGKMPAGSIAGGPRPDGYISISLGNRRYLAHRLAYQYATGKSPPKGMEIDHINGVKMDNRFANLRAVTRQTNQENWLKPSKRKVTCGHLGVSLKNGRFVATVSSNYQSHHIGSFDTAEEAHAAYVNAKRKMHAGCTI